MAVVIVADGQVSIKPEAVDRTSTITGVSTSGSVATIDIETKKGKLLSLLCLHKVGADTTFLVEVFDNSAATEDYLVYSAETTVSTQKRLHVNTEQIGFNNSTNTNLYVKVTPTSGTGHTFFLRVQAEKSK